MGIPADINARRYYRVAYQRLEDGALMLDPQEYVAMAHQAQENHDSNVDAIVAALGGYEKQFPGSSASAYRQNPGVVRVRIVDDRFAGMPRSRRHDIVWQFLSQTLGEDAMVEISALILLPTAELRTSMANLEFEHSQL